MKNPKVIDIPLELVEPLKIMAVKNGISYSKQIILCLAQAVEAHKAKSFLK